MGKGTLRSAPLSFSIARSRCCRELHAHRLRLHSNRTNRAWRACREQVGRGKFIAAAEIIFTKYHQVGINHRTHALPVSTSPLLPAPPLFAFEMQPGIGHRRLRSLRRCWLGPYRPAGLRGCGSGTRTWPPGALALVRTQTAEREPCFQLLRA